MSIRDATLRYCAPLKNRVLILAPDIPISVSEVKSGVIFVFATWSAQAHAALDALAKSLCSETAFDGISLYVADNDAESTEQFMASIRQTPSGKGETFWISDGKVVASLNDYSTNKWDALLQNNRKLVSSK